jgi:DNA-binding NarL/FixJ family response regulator
MALDVRPEPASVPQSQRQQAREHGLTARELEVLRLIAAGHTNSEIGDQLFISPTTVARHITNIYTKLGIHSRMKATMYAHQHHLV